MNKWFYFKFLESIQTFVMKLKALILLKITCLKDTEPIYQSFMHSLVSLLSDMYTLNKKNTFFHFFVEGVIVIV